MNFFSSVVKQESVVSEEELRWEVWARTGSAGLLQDQVKIKSLKQFKVVSLVSGNGRL